MSAMHKNNRLQNLIRKLSLISKSLLLRKWVIVILLVILLTISQSLCNSQLLLRCWYCVKFSMTVFWKIHQYQKLTDLLLWRLSFQCLIQEIAISLMINKSHFQISVILALQKITETMLIKKFMSMYHLMFRISSLTSCSDQFMCHSHKAHHHSVQEHAVNSDDLRLYYWETLLRISYSNLYSDSTFCNSVF